MVKRKQIKKTKRQKALTGNTNALKVGTSKGTSVDKLLKNNGIDLDKVKPKMENYGNILEWNDDSMAYMIKKAEVMKSYIELAHTLGGKAIEIQDEINRLSMFLDLMERKHLEDGINPLEDKQYLAALKLKKDYLIEKGKLNLDIGKAATDYAIKKKNNPEAFKEDDLW